jgi:hypothetical protein
MTQDQSVIRPPQDAGHAMRRSEEAYASCIGKVSRSGNRNVCRANPSNLVLVDLSKSPKIKIPDCNLTACTGELVDETR